jgi:hypothetical protein
VPAAGFPALRRCANMASGSATSAFHTRWANEPSAETSERIWALDGAVGTVGEIQEHNDWDDAVAYVWPLSLRSCTVVAVQRWWYVHSLPPMKTDLSASIDEAVD